MKSVWGFLCNERCPISVTSKQDDVEWVWISWSSSGGPSVEAQCIAVVSSDCCSDSFVAELRWESLQQTSSQNAGQIIKNQDTVRFWGVWAAFNIDTAPFKPFQVAQPIKSRCLFPELGHHWSLCLECLAVIYKVRSGWDVSADDKRQPEEWITVNFVIVIMKQVAA